MIYAFLGQGHVFDGLRSFAAFMARSVAYERVADTAARGAVAEMATAFVKARIGHPDLLPPPLAPSTQAEREHLGYAPDETLLRTGELRDSYKWAHVSLRKTQIGSELPRALWHEFGVEDAGRNHATRIPGRAPLARTMTDHNAELFAAYLAAFNLAFRPR